MNIPLVSPEEVVTKLKPVAQKLRAFLQEEECPEMRARASETLELVKLVQREAFSAPNQIPRVVFDMCFERIQPLLKDLDSVIVQTMPGGDA